MVVSWDNPETAFDNVVVIRSKKTSTTAASRMAIP
jgi:hypothetical protein